MSLVPYWSAEDLTLYLGDCRAVMAGFEAESFDAVVCDPPYGLEFMGAEWDSFRESGSEWSRKLATGPDWKGTGRERPGRLYMRSHHDTCTLCGKMKHRHDDAKCPEADYGRVTHEPAQMRAYQQWCELWAAECIRVLKPGGYLLAFGGTRTYHRLACGIEDAGFEIRDSIHWIYGSGFPKGLDVSKAIDKMAGAEREVVASGEPLKRMIPGATQNGSGSWIKDDGREFVPEVTIPATAEAAEWEGWNVALKPAHEPIVLARKPLAGTVVQNVLAHGTGALNIGACRVYASESVVRPPIRRTDNEVYGHGLGAGVQAEPSGRWPSNVLFSHSAGCEQAGTALIPGNIRLNPTVVAARANIAKGAEAERRRGVRGHGNADGTETVPVWICQPGCPVAELDRQSGVLTSGANPERRGSDKFRDAYGEFAGQRECVPARGADSGGASRFFPVFRYEAKASATERPRLPDGTAHPTVKPSELMIWLVKLVSRPGALILDPFAGSGTTGEACLREGRRCVLIEREPKFAELARVRLSKPIQPGMFDMEAV